MTFHKKNIRTENAGLLYQEQKNIVLMQYQWIKHHLCHLVYLPLDDTTYQVIPIYFNKQAKCHMFLILHKKNIIAAE